MKTVLSTIFSIFFSASLFANTVYVSSTVGIDKNDGSINAPIRTVAEALKRNPRAVKFRCGDVFYETLGNFTNVSIDSYGSGAKPLFCGLKILENNDAWEKLPDGIMRLDLEKSENFSGYQTSGKQNNIGAIYDISRDKLYGNLVRNYKALKADYEFWVSDSPDADVRSKSQTFKYLYLKTSEHPSKIFKKLALLPFNFGIRKTKNCEIKNLAVKGFGAHGISKAWNCRFSNIDIDLIGGSLLVGYPRWVRFGNGIEFWMSEKEPCNDNTVEGCFISRTYDCGSTIQGNLGKTSRPQNIKFINNRFLRCRQAFEHWTATPCERSVFENCEFSGNKAFDMGFNEFSTPYRQDTSLLSYERKPISGLVVKDNVFWGAPVYFSAGGYVAKMSGNTFYTYAGTYLYRKSKKEIPARGDGDIAETKKELHNDGDTIVLVDKSDSALRAKIIETRFGDMKSSIADRDVKLPRPL